MIQRRRAKGAHAPLQLQRQRRRNPAEHATERNRRAASSNETEGGAVPDSHTPTTVDDAAADTVVAVAVGIPCALWVLRLIRLLQVTLPKAFRGWIRRQNEERERTIAHCRNDAAAAAEIVAEQDAAECKLRPIQSPVSTPQCCFLDWWKQTVARLPQPMTKHLERSYPR
jgi:hypothetical protein